MRREKSHENAKQAHHWTHVIGVREDGSCVKIHHLVDYFFLSKVRRSGDFCRSYKVLSEAEMTAGDVL